LLHSSSESSSYSGREYRHSRISSSFKHAISRRKKVANNIQ
jgi:hypothetical protein